MIWLYKQLSWRTQIQLVCRSMKANLVWDVLKSACGWFFRARLFKNFPHRHVLLEYKNEQYLKYISNENGKIFEVMRFHYYLGNRVRTAFLQLIWLMIQTWRRNFHLETIEGEIYFYYTSLYYINLNAVKTRNLNVLQGSKQKSIIFPQFSNRFIRNKCYFK